MQFTPVKCRGEKFNFQMRETSERKIANLKSVCTGMGQKEEKKKNTWAFALSHVHITKLREGVVSGVPLNFLKHQDCAFCALLAARLSRLKQRLNLTQSCMRDDKAVSELYRASSEFTEAASESPEARAVFFCC